MSSEENQSAIVKKGKTNKVAKKKMPYAKRLSRMDEILTDQRGSGRRDIDYRYHAARMERKSQEALRQDICVAIKNLPQSSVYLCVRLSFKNKYYLSRSRSVNLTPEYANAAVLHFLNCLNKSIFKRAYQYRYRELWRIDCHEGRKGSLEHSFNDPEGYKNPHRHLLIKVPNDISPNHLKEEIRRIWTNKSEDKKGKATQGQKNAKERKKRGIDWARRSDNAVHIEVAETPEAVATYITKNGIDAFCPKNSIYKRLESEAHDSERVRN